MTQNSAKSSINARLRSFFLKFLYYVSRTPFVWCVKAGVTAFHWRDRVARRRVARQMGISGEIHEKAKLFNRDGFVMLNEFVDQDMLAEMARASDQKALRADELISRQTLTHKSFWIRLLDEDKVDDRFDTDNVFVRFAIQPGIVQFVTAVLGEPPLLTDVLLTLSRETGEQLNYSQLWHRDYDDPRTVKLFVYLSDVKGRDDGPFTFVPKPESDRLGFSLRSHLADDYVFRRIDKKAVREMIAPKLSVFMVETSRCLHMGSRMAPGHVRLLYSAIFVLSPRVYPVRSDIFRVTTSLSIEQKLVLGHA